MSDTLVGTQLKMAVEINADGVGARNIDFACQFFTSPSRKVEISKAQMRYVEDGGYYLALVDTTGMASGVLRMRVTAFVPDVYADGLLRREETIAETDVTLIRR